MEENNVVFQSLVTYKIVSDLGGRLKEGARTACNFWNRFLVPDKDIVIRLGIFTSVGNVIARAYRPYQTEGVRYGRVEFNTLFLGGYSKGEIAGTIIHEIGHTLGIGWEVWDGLFEQSTGVFRSDAVAALPALEAMRVETDFGQGTQFSHWDEDQFDEELMTGFKDAVEHVLPVTIDVMELFGHRVLERLPARRDLAKLLEEASQVLFSLHDAARSVDRDHFEETEVFENVPHHVPIGA